MLTNMCVRKALGLALLLLAAVTPGAAHAAIVSKSVSFTASDGVVLHALVGGEEDLRPRPLIVEFSPYNPACCGNSFGAQYNNVQVHARGTGESNGVWSAVGPRDQQDVSEFLTWACKQPWSNGHIGLYGFSASAIAVYNSLYLPLACVDAAALMAGTADLYRDLLYPGGIMNFVPGAVVGFGVGGLILAGAPARLQDGQSVLEPLQSGVGFLGTITSILAHQTEDDFWLGHAQRPGPNTFPVLADTSFYDPEARGPFESFRLLRDSNPGTHLLLYGAHDGFPAGIDAFAEYKRWFDHYLLGSDNGIDRDPPVRLLLGNGSRQALLAGQFTRVDGSDWPLPGTRWQRMYLDPAKAGSATRSLNDGSLSDASPAAKHTQSYPAIVSIPTATDPHTISVTGNALDPIPSLTQMDLGEPGALAYTSKPFSAAVDVAGPASLDVFVATTSPASDLHAVVADVWPDGRAFPIGQGRLRTSYPDIDRSRSLIDAGGEVVQPYGVYSAKQLATPGRTREYHVEFWPLGNHFAAGHRLRLYLVGTAATMLPTLPSINTVSLGGDTRSRLLIPLVARTRRSLAYVHLCTSVKPHRRRPGRRPSTTRSHCRR
jgi:predicted acyl esterase